jgi:mitogen-activated protein kinase kinase kinase
MESSSSSSSVEAEFAFLQSLDSPQVVRVLHLEQFRDPCTGEAVTQIFMELCKKGSLHALVRNPKSSHQRPQQQQRLHELTARAYLADALRGLAYLHGKGVIHRDVKPQNMLISVAVTDGYGTLFPLNVAPGAMVATQQGCISGGGGNGDERRRARRTLTKLSDFGSSRWAMIDAEGGVCKTTQNVVGTAPYMSPESVRGKFSFASDIWAFGVTFLELVTDGGNVWGHLGARDGFGLILKLGLLDKPELLPPVPAHCSRGLADVIHRCLELDYRKRLSSEDLLRLPYFAEPIAREEVEAF